MQGPQAPQQQDIGRLYKAYAPMVLRRILHFYPRQEAEEVLQEVFLHVIEKMASFRHEASPSTWLYAMTTNHCINRRRNHGRRQELWAEHGEHSSWTWARHAPSQESQLLLRQLWRTLPEELVTLGTYYYLDGMTHAEIARLLNVSRRTVGNRLDELTRHILAADAAPLAPRDAGHG